MKPNVVLIDCHDLGDWLGCYGQDWLRTPNIDRLAKEGTCFENHFAPSPQCIPSRMGIYCSRYAHTHDVYGQMPPSDEPLFMAQQFSQHGYQTTLSNHLNMPVTPELAGFQMRTSTPPTTQGTAQEFFSHADSSGKSFFVHFSFGLVHRPFGQEFDAERVPTLPVPEVLPDTIITRRDLATLASQVEQLDTAVGWILSALDEAGLNDQTIVIFTTDHGVALARHKHTLYDRGLRTALLLRSPSQIPAGLRSDVLLSNTSLFPTLCELTGIPVPSCIHGRSFKALFHEGVYKPDEAIFSSVSWTRRSQQLHYCPARSIRTSRYKLIWNFTESPCYLDSGYLGRHANDLDIIESWPLFGKPSPEFELYDLEQDPWEKQNLSGNVVLAEVEINLRAKLRTFLDETGDRILAGKLPNFTSEAVKPMWLKSDDGTYQLNFDGTSECHERPFELLYQEA